MGKLLQKEGMNKLPLFHGNRVQSIPIYAVRPINTIKICFYNSRSILTKILRIYCYIQPLDTASFCRSRRYL